MITLLLHIIICILEGGIAGLWTAATVATITEMFRLVDDIRDFIIFVAGSIALFAVMIELWKIFGLCIHYYFY